MAFDFDIKTLVDEAAEPLVIKRGDKVINVTSNTAYIYDASEATTVSPITLTFIGNGTVRCVKLIIDAK